MDTPFAETLQREVITLQALFPDLTAGLEKACAILREQRLFMEDSGWEAMVRSSDGTRWYCVNGSCTCPASQYHSEPCKHRLALRLYQRVCDRLAPEEERWDISTDTPMGQEARQPPAIPAVALVQIQGKAFVRFEGLLALAHAQGLVHLETTVVQCSFDLAVCQSTARFQDGRTFTDIGDASPENVAKNLRPHFIRMAATRASARALRRALNVNTCTVEECGDDAATSGTPPTRGIRERLSAPSSQRG